MPQSLAQIYIHLVFSTKERIPLIPAETGPRLHAYLAGAGQAIQCPVLMAGGIADHVHLLFRLSKNLALSNAVRELKVESSKWMKEQGVPSFAWQAGYGAFSIGASQVEAVTDYIRHQERHHRQRTFQEEFRELLRRYQLEFDEAYLWD